MGCAWNMPGDYSNGSFDSCEGDTGEVGIPSVFVSDWHVE